MMNKYKDNIVAWDVNNENLHGEFFERATKKWDILDEMIKEAGKQAPNADIMVNDYALVAAGTSTVALADSVIKMSQRGADVDAIGIQSHIVGEVYPELISRRLDTLAEAGVPLWITELDISGFEDRNKRADMYEKALRLYFSRQDVAGVLVWGFWDQQHWRPDAAMWEGDDIMPNAAGQRWMDLVHGEWKTNVVLRPKHHDQTFNIRAFQGDYSVNFKYNGVPICENSNKYDVPQGTDPKWILDGHLC